MKNNNAMKVSWAYINALGTIDESKNAKWAQKHWRESTIPLHEDAEKSLDSRLLNFDGLKVVVALEHKGLPAHIFKALEYITFYTEEGQSGDLIDFLEYVNQELRIHFCVHDELGKYEVKMTLHLEGAAKKGLPPYMVIDRWNVYAPSYID